jgi:hypothetical protein
MALSYSTIVEKFNTYLQNNVRPKLRGSKLNELIKDVLNYAKDNILSKADETLTAANAYTDAEIAAKVAGLLDLRGGYDASTNLFPSTGGSGEEGAILKGDTWFVTVPGEFDENPVITRQSFFALEDNPGQNPAYWQIMPVGFITTPSMQQVSDAGNRVYVPDGESVFILENIDGTDYLAKISNNADEQGILEIKSIVKNQNTVYAPDRISYSNDEGNSEFRFPSVSNGMLSDNYNTIQGVPDVNYDFSKGYVSGSSIIRDVNTQIEYLCIDNSGGSAVWMPLSGTYDPVGSSVISNANAVSYHVIGNIIRVSANVDLNSRSYGSNEGFRLPIFSNIALSDVNAVVTFDDGVRFQFIKVVAVEFSATLPYRAYVQFTVPANPGKAFITLTYPLL